MKISATNIIVDHNGPFAKGGHLLALKNLVCVCVRVCVCILATFTLDYKLVMFGNNNGHKITKVYSCYCCCNISQQAPEREHTYTTSKVIYHFHFSQNVGYVRTYVHSKEKP